MAWDEMQGIVKFGTQWHHNTPIQFHLSLTDM